MSTSEILIYQNTKGCIKIDVRLKEETVWLSQVQLYEADRSAILAQWNLISKEQNV